MAKRSLVACKAGIEQAELALTERAWSRRDLQGADAVDVSRGTIAKFFAGKPIDRKIFVSICDELGLDWQVVAGLQPADIATETEAEPKPEVDALVQQVRAAVGEDIQARCGTMRVLDMSRPIGLEDIYTRVNILETISGRQRLPIEQLLQQCNLESFERFSLSNIREERISGLEAVKRHDKLMVLGKPGAGKTTFLKRLAILCNLGKFQQHRVPFFVTLKEFAKTPGQPRLLAYLSDWLGHCQGADLATAETILKAGRGLVLLDGLDEVQDSDLTRVLQDIKQFAEQFHCNQFAITCRIAAREYTFQQFTDVEVADFDQEQIAEFVHKWFQLKADAVKAERFLEKLKDNPPIQELASNPLLLTLLCLVFEEAADFSAKRSELYEDGLNILLKKWDASRNIERDQGYRKLSLKGKMALLSRLAFQRFQHGEYFFKQKQTEQAIAAYIENLPEAATDPEVLQLDSEAVLKSIEAQHGLLVERAKGIYSFSHLTFQEYFAAQQIASPTPGLEARLQALAQRATEPRWREVCLLTAGLLEPADLLLQGMKDRIDRLLAEDNRLQQFLAWGQQKAATVETSYKQAAVRAFYAWIARVYARVRVLALDLNLSLDLAPLFSPDRKHSPDHVRVRDLALALACDLDHSFERSFDQALDRNLFCVLSHARDLSSLGLNLRGTLSRGLTHDLDRNLNFALSDSTRDCALKPSLKRSLLNLQQQLLDPEQDWQEHQRWWASHGQAWTDQLQQVMVNQRNIGHDWQFSDESDEQVELLNQYLAANQLLVGCLQRSYVTRAVRKEIEETLLLPVAATGATGDAG